MCRKTASLCKSHIIPKFAGEWIKRNSMDGCMAHADRADKRVQDLRKVRLLCGDCEERFSRHESYFSREIFRPYHDGSESFEYDRGLESFAVSLSWRSLKVSYDKTKLEWPRLVPLIDEAESRWRSFLLGETQDAGPYESHLVFLGRGADAGRSLIGSDWYKLMSTDPTLAVSNYRVFAYSKLPHMFVVTAMRPSCMKGWKGTAIKANGTITTSQLIRDDRFKEFFSERARLYLTLSPGLSDEQRVKRFDKAMKRDPQRVLRSESSAIQLREADADRRKKMESMPGSVGELAECVIRQAARDPDADEERSHHMRFAGRRIADILVALPDDESRDLDLMIKGVMCEFEATQKHARGFFETNSLQVVFVADRNTTKGRLQSEIVGELRKLNYWQGGANTPTAVFFLNDGDSGYSLECGFTAWYVPHGL